MRTVRITKQRLYTGERKNTRNHKRGDSTAEKHRETERWKRKVPNSPYSNPSSSEVRGRQRQDKPGGPGNRLEILVT
jgi:hypothetical protein